MIGSRLQNRRLWVRLREKGGKHHEMPCHHNIEEYLTAYIEGLGLRDDPKRPLFWTIPNRGGQLTRTPLPQPNAYRMIRRRCAGIDAKVELPESNLPMRKSLPVAARKV